MKTYAAPVDYQQNRSCESLGTGDYGAEGGMYWVPLYLFCKILHHLRLSGRDDAKVVGQAAVLRPPSLHRTGY